MQPYDGARLQPKVFHCIYFYNSEIFHSEIGDAKHDMCYVVQRGYPYSSEYLLNKVLFMLSEL